MNFFSAQVNVFSVIKSGQRDRLWGNALKSSEIKSNSNNYYTQKRHSLKETLTLFYKEGGSPNPPWLMIFHDSSADA